MIILTVSQFGTPKTVKENTYIKASGKVYTGG